MNKAGHPVLLYTCTGVDHDAWLAGLAAAMPELEVRRWPDTGDVSEIDYGLAWRTPPGALAGLPNLRAIFSMGAGVEHVLKDATMPQHLPLVRMVDPALETGMREFVMLRVLHYHRRIPELEANQRQGLWKELYPKLPEDQRVSVLGLGALGGSCAAGLVGLGFDVAGWSRSPKDIPGVKSFTGPDGFHQILERSDILVSVLPWTPETDGLLNAAAFAAMPRGAYLINTGRGRHVVEPDLLSALDSGQIAGASLDVFETEPLPAEHRFWTHPSVSVTPHCCAVTHPKSASRTIAAGIRRDQQGLPLLNLADRDRGY
jgi:glyoxylate/hydroxypyruvate reductase A